MKLDKQDFKRLQWSILLLLALSLLGAAAVWFSTQQRDQAERDLKAAQARQTDIQARLARARDEEQELRHKIARYQTIDALGYIGPERRLDWMEAIAAIKSERRIHSLDYEFLAQRPADGILLPGGPQAGAHDVVVSTMRLRMALLHEGDLLNFIVDLRDMVQAMIAVRHCTLEKNPQAEPRGPQLVADCTLDWITFKERR